MDSVSQCYGDLGLATGVFLDAVALDRLADLIQLLFIDRAPEQHPAARPLAFPCMAKHVGADWIAFDVALAGQYIVFRLGEAGAEAACRRAHRHG